MMQRFKINPFIAAFLIVFIVLQSRLWFQSGGILDMFRLRKQLKEVVVLKNKSKAENDVLIADIKKMKNNDQATEARARSELGMIKNNETFYRIVGNEK